MTPPRRTRSRDRGTWGPENEEDGQREVGTAQVLENEDKEQKDGKEGQIDWEVAVGEEGRRNVGTGELREGKEGREEGQSDVGTGQRIGGTEQGKKELGNCRTERKDRGTGELENGEEGQREVVTVGRGEET